MTRRLKWTVYSYRTGALFAARRIKQGLISNSGPDSRCVVARSPTASRPCVGGTPAFELSVPKPETEPNVELLAGART
ncbi:gMP synthase-like protein [Anopheles sinensis]|uniref:GMP synthase-like protein n=1 Tax=Anopheles sinensis TaxID=74873 RepID=A0A084WU21_ANOSI|nr:gMP synthase-like protein [Anopheles sinensis]